MTTATVFATESYNNFRDLRVPVGTSWRYWCDAVADLPTADEGVADGDTAFVFSVASLYDYTSGAWVARGAAVLGWQIPVGGLFSAIVGTSPATLLGYGSWTAVAAGAVCVGLGAAPFDTLEATGGALTATPSAHAGTAVANHASHTHDAASSPATPDLFTSNVTGAGVGMTTGGPNATMTHSVTQPNDHAALSIVQPWYVVKIWKRTA